MTKIHTVRTAYIAVGNHNDNNTCEFIEELRKYVESGWSVKKIWYEPQYAPTDSYYNATLETEDNE